MFRLLALCVVVSAAMAATNSPSTVTFNKDVLPILQKNCQTCHRPGEVAPMPLLNYKETRPWAKAIKTAVATRKMPPWFADPGYGHFTNERRLTDAEIATLVSWVDNGAAEGDAKDAPAPLKWREGWNIQPDIIVEMPVAFDVPATGILDYDYFVVKTNFPEDLWVKAVELRPGDRRVIHHMKAIVRPPGSQYLAGAVEGAAFIPSRQRTAGRPPSGTLYMDSEVLAKYNPGLGPQYFDGGEDAAKFIPKGSDIIFEVHYNTIGTPTKDRSRVGIQLAKTPPKRRYLTLGELNASGIHIKPGEADYVVRTEGVLQHDAELVGLQPHEHLRGTEFDVQAIYPTGESEWLLKSKWDFHWQLGYDFAAPKMLPKGTKVVTIARYDNSANNPNNPDPTAEINTGPQSQDEMSMLWFNVIVDAETTSAKAQLFPTPARRGPAPVD
jgi:hypothetical protein